MKKKIKRQTWKVTSRRFSVCLVFDITVSCFDEKYTIQGTLFVSAFHNSFILITFLNKFQKKLETSIFETSALDLQKKAPISVYIERN